MITKLAAYVVMGINEDGRKEVLTIEVGENESSKYWLGVLNSLKNRGVRDILILCSDGLAGLKKAISATFPKTEHQRCIVHMVRNTLKYVANKDMKNFAKDLRTIKYINAKVIEDLFTDFYSHPRIILYFLKRLFDFCWIISNNNLNQKFNHIFFIYFFPKKF